MSFFICKCDKNDIDDKGAENFLDIKNLEESLKRETSKYDDYKSLNSINVIKSVIVPEKLEIIEYPYSNENNINLYRDPLKNNPLNTKQINTSKINKPKPNYNLFNNIKNCENQKNSQKEESIIIDDFDYLNDEDDDNDIPDNKNNKISNCTNNNLQISKKSTDYRNNTIKNVDIKRNYAKNCLTKNNRLKNINQALSENKYNTIIVKPKKTIINHSNTQNKINQLNKNSKKYKFKNVKPHQNIGLSNNNNNYDTKIMCRTEDNQLIKKKNKKLQKSQGKSSFNNFTKINNCFFGKNCNENKNIKKEFNNNKKFVTEKVKQRLNNQISTSNFSQNPGRIYFSTLEPVVKKLWN